MVVADDGGFTIILQNNSKLEYLVSRMINYHFTQHWYWWLKKEKKTKPEKRRNIPMENIHHQTNTFKQPPGRKRDTAAAADRRIYLKNLFANIPMQ